jgi:hypothetical protein
MDREPKAKPGRGGKRPGAGRKPGSKSRTRPKLRKTSIQLSPDLLARVDALAAERGMSRSALISSLLEIALADLPAPSPSR